MKSRFLLDVVVAQGTSVFQLLSSKNKTLLVWWDTFLVLNLGFDIIDSIRWLNIQSDSLSSECLDKNLHSSSETKNQMKSRLLLNVVVTQRTAIFQLLSSEDETLLVWWDTFLVLNLGFDVVNGVGWFDIKSDSLSSECLDENLHSSSETKNQMKSRLLLNVVVTQRTAIFQLLSSEDETLLVWWDTFLVLNLGLDVVNGIRWFNI